MKNIIIIIFFSFVVLFFATTGSAFNKFNSSILNTKPPIKYVYEDDLSPQAMKQVECLAQNIYFEAATEPFFGKKAVAFVTLNRMYDGYFPKTICEVVKQKRQGVCQFSWYCEGDKASNPRKYIDEEAYYDIKKLAIDVYANHQHMKDPTHGALFYHANYVNPEWRRAMTKTAVIGKHIFYTHKTRG